MHFFLMGLRRLQGCAPCQRPAPRAPAVGGPRRCQAKRARRPCLLRANRLAPGDADGGRGMQAAVGAFA